MRRSGWGPPEKDPHPRAPRRRPTSAPSSKTCSGCGWRNPSLTLSDRTFSCPSCGLVIDRDENAAVNLARLVDREYIGDVKTARGADRKTNAPAPPARRRVAVKREPGTAKTGQTRGASPKGEAA
ncbi:hypothetical protein FMEAI12_7430002 [Parafrankia sp. Ea1.12]|nr:hypothetical protein FMEAI12_7430002 [Parafrankia sp. Ea1.12]